MFPRRRRRKLRATPLTDAQRATLRRLVPVYRRLSEADRAELEGHVQVLLAEKRFEGAGGLEVTEAMRLSIAGQAALLLLHRDTDYYPQLTSVVIYPHPYKTSVRRDLGGGVVLESQEHRLGESWHHGTLVLAWDAVSEGAMNPGDGLNVVFHEFAHQLDAEAGGTDGAPDLPRRAAYGPWARVLGAEFAQLKEALATHNKSFLRAYGATNPAEFFAVVTEVFFERPAALRAYNPELYAQLAGFYQQDPAAWGD